MTTAIVETLTNPPQSSHMVYPYSDESQIVDAVSLFATVGFQRGEGVMLVMTSIHCGPIRQRLEAEGFNLSELEASGKLICEDAAYLLSTFMVDGILDEHKFKNTIVGMIQKAKKGGGGRRRPVRAFAEMVDLLWKTDRKTTKRLEDLLNEVMETESVCLLCAYWLHGTKLTDFPEELLARHSHTVS